MMCRNRELIARKLVKRPRILSRVLRHIRRYGALIEQRTGKPLPADELEECRLLLREIASALSPLQRRRALMRCRCLALRLHGEAVLNSRKADFKRRQLRFCLFMAEQLGA